METGKYSVSQPFDAILALINKRKFDEAKSKIAAARETLPANQIHRLTALSAVLEIDAGNFAQGIALIREAIEQEPTWLPHWYRLCIYLMDEELWLEAIEAANKVISLSEHSGDPYFLDDAKFRRLFCLKALGRYAEIPSPIRDIKPDIQVFIGDTLYTLADLDGRATF